MLYKEFSIPLLAIILIAILYIFTLAFGIWLTSMLSRRKGYEEGVRVTRMEKRRKIREKNIQKYPSFYNANHDPEEEIELKPIYINRRTR